MKCDDCQSLFSLYHDGEIAPDQRATVESHLRACAHCSNEWQAFKATLAILHHMPRASVPPGFLAGIHHKIETKSPLARIREWFSGAVERKVAIPAAFAMLVIGFVCASLIQTIPFPGGQDTASTRQQASSQIAGNDDGPRIPALVATNDTKKGHQDFYPGVPLLSEYAEGEDNGVYPQFAMVPRQPRSSAPTTVDFVSTGGGHVHSYLDMPLSALSRYHQRPAIQPDLLITLHSGDPAEQLTLMRQIMQSPDWQADVYNQKTVLLSVPAGNFDQLRQLCCQKTTTFTPAYARDSRYISPKRFLTVAVTLE